MAALDGRRRAPMKDMGVLAAGNLMGQRPRHRPGDPEADRPDGHPRLQRRERVRHRRHRAAHRDHGGQGRRSRLRPRGRRREARGRGTARRRRSQERRERLHAVWSLRRGRARSTVASAPRPCRACSRRSACSTSTSTSTADAPFELFARISEKNHSHSTLNPFAAYQKKMSPRRDHERRDDRLPEHRARCARRTATVPPPRSW